MTDIGVGLLSPYKITISMLAGSLVSWGIMLPYIKTKEGCWYPRGVGGINTYRWFIGIAMVLADGLCQLLFILLRTLRAMHRRRHPRLAAQPSMDLGADGRRPARSFDDRRRAQVFLRDRVYDPAAVAGYIALAAVSIVAIPFLYPQLRPTHFAVAYLAAPLFAFCNAYGTGMNVDLGPTHGKIAVLAFGWWVGLQNGGVVAGLAGSVIILSAVITASDLMQVFRTGQNDRRPCPVPCRAVQVVIFHSVLSKIPNQEFASKLLQAAAIVVHSGCSVRSDTSPARLVNFHTGPCRPTSCTEGPGTGWPVEHGQLQATARNGGSPHRHRTPHRC